MEILSVCSVVEGQVSKQVLLNLGSKVLNPFSFTNINLAHILFVIFAQTA
jgi:hypothetical protein